MKRMMINIIALLLFLTANQAKATEPLSTLELTSHCSHLSKNPTGKDAIFCIRYIQGFIDGAIATDERVVSNLSGQNAREETFSERAIRTRLGNIKRYGSTSYAGFCLGNTSLKEVVNKIVRNLNNLDKAKQEAFAKNSVYKILRTNYPCKTTTKK